jgi:hypothetical protein
MERLHFGDAVDQDSTPRFVALPFLLPLPKGVSIQDQHPLVGGAPTDPPCPVLDMWLDGLAWVWAHNSRHSATVGGPMFDVDAIQSRAQAFQGLELIEQLPEAPVELLPPIGSVLSTQFALKMQFFDQAAYVRLGHQEELPVQAPPAQDPAHFLPNTIELKTAASLKDREFLSRAAEIAARWSLVFGHSEPNPDPSGPPVAVPAKLGLLGEIIKLSNSASAIHKIQEAVHSALARKQASVHYLDCLVTLTPTMITDALIRTICGFHRRPSRRRRNRSMPTLPPA